MNEQVDNAEYEFLWKLLANPADPNHSYIFSLQSLVNDYPQSGVLRALLMPNGDKRHIKHATAYFNPRVLHKLATAPDSLAVVTDDQIVFSDEPELVVADIYLNTPPAEPLPFLSLAPEQDYTPVDDGVVEEATTTDIDEPAAAETLDSNFTSPEEVEYTTGEELVQTAEIYTEDIPYIEEVSEIDNYPVEETLGTPIEDEPVHEEIAEAPIIEQAEQTEASTAYEESTSQSFVEENSLAKQYDAYLAESEAEPTSPVSSYEDTGDRYFHQAIDDEVYDEIVSIEDIGLEQLAILNKSFTEEGGAQESYFVFEPEIAKLDGLYVDTTQPQQPVPEPPSPQTVAEDLYPAVIAQDNAAQQNFTLPDDKSNVSKYNDDKMPYTFMWWLDKTRRDHADVYQPYANQSEAVAPPVAEQSKQKGPIDELQQQYYQNIVSTTSITDLDKTPPKAAASPRKETKIIERFIHDEPQIKHPAGIKLDNENKAKRSSEDKEELVTETLARIYTEQMLYHKAILTYKKLMLKYPEKSLYFASQIEQLESKIN